MLQLFYIKVWLISTLTVVSHETKEEVPCYSLSRNAHEYFTRKNLVKINNAITYQPYKHLRLITPGNKRFK